MPLVVIGLPEMLKMLGTVAATLETVPPPDAAIVMEPDALVTVMPVPAVSVARVKPVPLPMFSAPFAGVVVRPVPPLATPSVPVTPVVSGSPVKLVATPLVGVPSSGVTRVGEVDSTLLPEPVLVVTPVPPFATASVPARVTVPEEVIGPPLVVKPVVPPETSTLVTEPAPGPLNATVMAPLPLVMVTPEPAVSVAGVSVLPVVLPMSS